MSRFKKFLFQAPEYYLVILVLLAGYNPPFEFNSLFVLLAIILVVQIVLKHRISGLILAAFFLIINTFMLGALISELGDYAVFDSTAWQLLIGGTLIWCLNMFFSGIMIIKYVKMDEPKNPQIVYHQQKVM